MSFFEDYLTNYFGKYFGDALTSSGSRAGDCKVEQTFNRGSIDIICTADSGNGTIDPFVVPLNCTIKQVATNPGSPAPDTDYDIVLWDDFGIDVMGGALLNRSATVSEVAYPKDPTGGIIQNGVAVLGGVMVIIAGTNNVSAIIKIKLFIGGGV